MTPEARVPGRCQLLVQGQFVRERSTLETAEELKKPWLFCSAFIHSSSAFENESHCFFQLCEEDLLFTCPSSSNSAVSRCD